MKTKITPLIFKTNALKSCFLMAILLVIHTDLFANAITKVSPTRVTTKTKVTITAPGANFSQADADGVRLNQIENGKTTNISLIDRKKVNGDQITFFMNYTGDDVTGHLYVKGVDTGYIIEYVKPIDKVLETTSDFFIQEIYTNWNYKGRGYWRSKKDYKENTLSTYPNDNHELIGYRMQNGTIYSTGVDDELLEEKLLQMIDLNITQSDINKARDVTLNKGAGLKYYRKEFKAYSSNGVGGKTHSFNFIAAADKMDNLVDGAEKYPRGDAAARAAAAAQFKDLARINTMTVLQSITMGVNGLDLGTGVTNFNQKTDVQFFSGNGDVGAIADHGTPDLLITQIADATRNSEFDLYYYADKDGNIMGRPVLLKMLYDTKNTIIARWRLDLYDLPQNQDVASVTPNQRADYKNNETRPIRMAAFTLENFDINESDIPHIENITMSAGGAADIAFMAYNAESFNINGPVVKTVLPQYVCVPDGESSATFKLKVGTVAEGGNFGLEDKTVEGGMRKEDTSLDAEKNIEWKYRVWRNGKPIKTTPEYKPLESFIINNVTDIKLGLYKLEVENGQGSVFVPIELSQGGTPYTWKNGQWKSPYEKFPGDHVADKEKGLKFYSNYNQDLDNLQENENLEGCDCYVAPGVNVTIPKDKTIKLYGGIEVSGEVKDEDDNVIVGSGTFTLENNASLVQISGDVENKGEIIVKRDAENLKKYDYVYWSSPVVDGNVSMIPGATQHVYQWDVNAFVEPNQTPNTLGNWGPIPNGIMTSGRGYIKRVNGESIIPSVFKGKPNNGLIDVELEKTKTTGSSAMDTQTEKHQNLVGNPYPSAIDAKSFLVENENLEGYVKIWAHDTEIFNSTAGEPFYGGGFKYNYGDQYLTFNDTGTVPENERSFEGNIASGQGFFVKLRDETDLTVTFNNSMRYDENRDAYENDNFFRHSGPSHDQTPNEKQLIWLSMVNEKNVSSITLVGYVEGATDDKDRLYDAGSGKGDMRIYSRIDEEDFLIQGRALPFKDNDQVPLGIEVLKNGIYKIGIDHLKGSLMLDEGQGIYLEDTYTDVIHDLRSSPYGFTANKGDVKDRFVLRYSDRALSIEEREVSNTFVYIKNDQLHIKADKNIERIKVYDLTGKQVLDYFGDGFANTVSTPFQFSKGVYLTEIKLENSESVTKKIIN